MTRNSRLDRLERATSPVGRPQFVMHDDSCEANGLPWDEHVAWHRARGVTLFTMDLGAASIREDDNAG